jgi:autotransporter-associated beta strand protein
MKTCTTTAYRVHLFVFAALIAAPTAYAQNGTWLGNGLDWNNSGAWVGGTIATGAQNTANFTGADLTSDVSMALGVNRTIGNIIFTDAGTSSHNLTLTGSTLTLDTTSGTPNINVTQPDRNLTISSVVAGADGIQKTGQGTLTLTGSNTITGATSISGGGRLVLDYSTNDNRKLPNNSTLSLAAGTIVLRGGTATESFTSTTFNTGTNGTFFVRDGGTAKINLNAFTVGTSSVVSFSHDSMATTDRTNVAGILGAWFTVGNRWAANSSNSTDGDIVGYTGGTTFTPGSATNADVNYDLAGGATLTASRPVNTLRIESTANDQILNLGGNVLTVSNLTGTNALTGTSGGLLYAGGANGNYTITGTSAARLTPENGNGQALLINVSTGGTLNLDVRLSNSGSTLNKAGEGTLVMQQDNSTGFTAAVRVYQGALRLANAGATGSTAGGITVQNGAALELSGGLSFVADALSITGQGISNGGALKKFSGANTYQGAITIGTGGARINSDSGTLTLTGGVVTASGNNVTFGGAGNSTVSTVAISGGGGLIKEGAGITTLSATNSYTGATSVNAGTLVVNGSLAAGSAVSVGVSGTLGGTGTISGATTILGAHTPGTSPGIQTFGGNLTYTGGSSTVQWELVENTMTNPANPNADYDQIIVGGNLEFDGATSLSLVFNGSGSSVLWANSFWDTDQQWTLYDVTGLTTDFGNLSLAAGSYLDSGSNTLASARPSASFSISQSGSDVLISYVAVPEPATIAILGVGVAFLGFRFARRRTVSDHEKV